MLRRGSAGMLVKELENDSAMGRQRGRGGGVAETRSARPKGAWVVVGSGSAERAMGGARVVSGDVVGTGARDGTRGCAGPPARSRNAGAGPRAVAWRGTAMNARRARARSSTARKGRCVRVGSLARRGERAAAAGRSLGSSSAHERRLTVRRPFRDCERTYLVEASVVAIRRSRANQTQSTQSNRRTSRVASAIIGTFRSPG